MITVSRKRVYDERKRKKRESKRIIEAEGKRKERGAEKGMESNS